MVMPKLNSIISVCTNSIKNASKADGIFLGDTEIIVSQDMINSFRTLNDIFKNLNGSIQGMEEFCRCSFIFIKIVNNVQRCKSLLKSEKNSKSPQIEIDTDNLFSLLKIFLKVIFFVTARDFQIDYL